jgi:hypothetical protein
METVLGAIENLLSEFTPNPIPVDSRVKLDDPFTGAFNDLRLNVAGELNDKTLKETFFRYQEERHYSDNITVLLYYFLYYLNNYSQDEHVRWDFYSRLTLDLEKLLVDIRSFLDAVYRLTLLYSKEAASISKEKRGSFGSFATWVDKNNVNFGPPLSFMKELVPWGLTVRKVRDDYVHYGHEAAPFWGADDVYFNPYGYERPVRRMPELFYPPEHPDKMRTDPDKPIYLRKFIVYLVAPVVATELVLGRYFDQLFASGKDYWLRHGEGYPFRATPEIQSLFDFLDQNREVLDDQIYRTTYFI